MGGRMVAMNARGDTMKASREALADQSVDTLLPASAIYQQWDPITPTHQTQS
jgi:hypothetical protein